VEEGWEGLVGSEKILLTVREVAALTGFSEGTLRHWISQRRGITYVRISPRCIRFRRSDIDAWIAERVVEPVGDRRLAGGLGRREGAAGG
jgi:excisionase family DNA binding protein